MDKAEATRRWERGKNNEPYGIGSFKEVEPFGYYTDNIEIEGEKHESIRHQSSHGKKRGRSKDQHSFKKT